LRNTGYDGNIILAVSPILDQDIEDYLVSQQVIINKVKYVPCSHPIKPEMAKLKDLSQIENEHDREMVTCLDPYPTLKHRWARFPLLRDLLLDCGGHTQPHLKCGGPVLITDMRDTIFQRNPFGPEAPPVTGLQVFQEHYTIRTTHWLVDWPVGDCKGVHYDEPMLCSGTTIGTRKAMLDYLSLMHTEMNTWMNTTKCCCFDTNGDDQSMHNYLYYSGMLQNVDGGVHAITNRMGLVHTVGAQASLLFEANLQSKTKLRLAKGQDTQTARDGARHDYFDLSSAETDNGNTPKEDRTNWLGMQYGLTDKDGYILDIGQHGNSNSKGSNSQRSFIIHQYDRFGPAYGHWIEKNKHQLYL